MKSFWDLAYEAGDHREHWESPWTPPELAAAVAAGLAQAGGLVLDVVATGHQSVGSLMDQYRSKESDSGDDATSEIGTVGSVGGELREDAGTHDEPKQGRNCQGSPIRFDGDSRYRTESDCAHAVSCPLMRCGLHETVYRYNVASSRTYSGIGRLTGSR